MQADILKHCRIYQTVLFDFDGVLSTDKLYESTLLPEYPKVFTWTQKNIFSESKTFNAWMRGHIHSREVNMQIAQQTGMELSHITALYEQSIRDMRLNQEMIQLARHLRSVGTQVGIVTSNIDAFSYLTVPHHNLKEIFPVIVNSADRGLLKSDNGGQLFDIALDLLGADVRTSLLLDDAPSNIMLFKRKGGSGFLITKGS